MMSFRLLFFALLALCLTKGYKVYSQPKITLQPGPIVFHLDASGKYNVSLADVASVSGVTDPSTQVTLVPSVFDCSGLGPQIVTVTATNGTFSTPTNPSASSFGGPWNITVDASGNLYFTDFGNNKIKKITPVGAVSTIAGSGNKACNDGVGTNASFSYPIGIVTDNAGNVYVADALCNVIKKINPSGNVTTLAGDGMSGYKDGAGTGAEFNTPLGLTIDASGNLYVADELNERIRKITPGGVVTTVAGNGSRQSADGGAAAAAFSDPSGLVFDNAGNLYITDAGSSRIREISAAGVVTTLAGSGTSTGSADGPGNVATFNGPYGITIDKAGNLFVSDRFNNEIRKITPAGLVSTFAGNTALGPAGGSTDGVGTAASFSDPTGLVFDASGDLFVADRYNHKIRKITPDGTVSTFAGDGKTGDVDGNIGGAPATGKQSVLAVQVTIVSSPVFGTPPDVNINADVTCDATLPDYTLNTKVTDNCAEAKLTVTQQPVAGTKMPFNIPAKVTLAAKDNYGGVTSTSFYVTVANKPVIIPNQAPIILTIDATGKYIVKLADVATVTSCVNPSPTVKISPGTFTCSDLGNQTVSIIADDGAGGTRQQLVAVTVQNSATIINDLANNQVVSTEDCITTLPDYTPLVIAKDNCTGGSILFTQTPLPGTGLTVGVPVTVTVSTVSPLLNMLSDSFTVTALQSQTPVVSISSSVNAVCKGSPVTFNATVINGNKNLNYQWTVNGINNGINSSIFTRDGLNDNDVINCAVLNGNGCITPVFSNSITIKVNPLPEVSFNEQPFINEGASVKLYPVVSGNIVAYKWTPATGLSDPLAQNPTASPLNATTYQLQVISVDGCEAIASITVAIIKPIIIPTAFSPNGDGINDQWNIKNINYYLNCTVDVFNRYGQLIFHSLGYGQPWNGTANGAQLPSGTYYYIIDLKNNKGGYAGNVAILK
jgi:gliding motility-associated-like protein